jgi:hypothetical protein
MTKSEKVLSNLHLLIRGGVLYFDKPTDDKKNSVEHVGMFHGRLFIYTQDGTRFRVTVNRSPERRTS